MDVGGCRWLRQNVQVSDIAVAHCQRDACAQSNARSLAKGLEALSRPDDVLRQRELMLRPRFSYLCNSAAEVSIDDANAAAGRMDRHNVQVQLCSTTLLSVCPRMVLHIRQSRISYQFEGVGIALSPADMGPEQLLRDMFGQEQLIDQPAICSDNAFQLNPRLPQ